MPVLISTAHHTGVAVLSVPFALLQLLHIPTLMANDMQAAGNNDSQFPLKEALLTAGTGFFLSMFYFYRKKQTLPFKVRRACGPNGSTLAGIAQQLMAEG